MVGRMNNECPYEAVGKLSPEARQRIRDAMDKRSEEIVKNARHVDIKYGRAFGMSSIPIEIFLREQYG